MDESADGNPDSRKTTIEGRSCAKREYPGRKANENREKIIHVRIMTIIPSRDIEDSETSEVSGKRSRKSSYRIDFVEAEAVFAEQEKCGKAIVGDV